MEMRKLFFLLLTVLIVPLSINSQNVLRGKVINETNEPLAKALVKIKQIHQSVLTDHDGNFTFNNLPDTVYTLQVEHADYDDLEQKVKTNDKNPVLLKMERPSISLEEITVSATRNVGHSPMTYTDVSKKELDKLNSGKDLPYLLAYTPSFITTSDAGTGIGYTGFRIRGTDANRTNVTINGIPLNDSESQSVFFVDLPDLASSLNSVQVQRGVGTSTNGTAVFGASINMQTETFNSKPYFEISSSAGSFGTIKNTLKAGTGLINHFSVDVRLSNVQSDGYIDRAWVRMKSYFVSGNYYGNNTVVKLITFSGNEKTYQAWDGVDLSTQDRTYNDLGRYTDSNGNIQFYNNQTDNYLQTHYQLHFSHVFSQNFHLNAALHYTRGEGYYEEYKEARKYAEYGLIPDTIKGIALESTDLIRQKWLKNDFGGFTFSMNYKKGKTNSTLGGAANRYWCDHFGEVIWARNSLNLDPDFQYYFNRSLKTEANIYAKTNIEVMKNFFVYADLQYRYIQLKMNGQDDKYDEDTGKMRLLSVTHPFHFFNPKLGLNYEIDKLNSIYGSFAVANREPNRNNYTDAGINDKPTSERLFDTEIGYRFSRKTTQFGANFYYMKYKNQLILTGKVSEIGEPLTSNIPNSYRMGLELTGAFNITKGLKWNGNATFSENKISNFTEYVDSYDSNWNWIGTKEIFHQKTDISYSPNTIINSILSYSLSDFEVSLFSTFVSRQFIDNTSSKDRSIDPYFVNNLQFNYSWKLKPLKSIDFSLLINNLLNEQYETNGYNWYTYFLDGKRINEKRYFPQAGTHFLFSITLKM